MLSYRVIPATYREEMIRMQEEMLLLLPDKRWYFPSEEWEFDDWLRGGEALGCFDGDTLCGYAVITAAADRGEHSYARVLGLDPADTFDFHDVMVAPAYRRQGIHSEFLRRFAVQCREKGGKAVYATVDPDNRASRASFEKGGYVCLEIRDAYDGRPRCYYEQKL